MAWKGHKGFMEGLKLQLHSQENLRLGYRVRVVRRKSIIM